MRAKIEWSSGWKLDIHAAAGLVAVLVIATIMWGRPLWLFLLTVTPSGFIVANLSANISDWIKRRYSEWQKSCKP